MAAVPTIGRLTGRLWFVWPWQCSEAFGIVLKSYFASGKRMTLTKLQLWVLKDYERRLANSSLIRVSVISWLALIIGLTLLCWVSISLGAESALDYCVGFFFGWLARDLVRIRIAHRVWPAQMEVINWGRVRELIQTNEKQ